MAVLSRIRQRSMLAIGVIGFALLAFVISDLVKKGQFTNTSDVGSINGKAVAFEDFRIKVGNTEKNSPGTTTIAAANQVWDVETNVALLNTEFDNLGISTCDKHIIEKFKANPNIGKNPEFLNQLGNFDIAKFREFIKKNPTQLAFLKQSEKDADIQSKYEIYNSLVKGGAYTTAAEGKFKYELESNKVNFDYVAVPYSTIKDTEVKVTDADITEFMKKNEKRFKSEETREIEYVLVEDKASDKDKEVVKNKITGLLSSSVRFNKETGKNDTLAGFKTTSNVAEFIGENSDKPYDSSYVSKQELNPEVADKLVSLAPGEIYGPYIDGKYYCLTKLLARKAGAKTKASQIVIGWEGSQAQNQKAKRTKEQAAALAQSLLSQAQAAPTNFMMLAFQFSEDQSAQRGGDIGFIQKGQIPVKAFDDFLSNNGIGKLGVVETEIGFHIVSITDKQDGVRLGTVAQKIDASEETSNASYAKATTFEKDAADKDFAITAKKAGLTVAPSTKSKAMDENLGALGNQRQIVRWAYDKETSVNDIKRFELTNIGNVIVRLKKVNEKGLLSIEDAKPMVEMTIKNQKKAVLIIAKMKGATLDAIAKSNATTVQNAPTATVENAVLGTSGSEPKVVGTALGLAANKTSATIEGNTGVYVIKTKAVTKAVKLVKYDEYITKVKANASQVANRALPALKTNAKIEDKRADFY